VSEAGHHTPLDIFLGAAPKRARRHVVSLAILTIAAIAAVVLLVRIFMGTGSPYYVSPIEVGDITPRVSERGVIRGARNLTIRARLEGTAKSVPGPESGPVKFGQLLAEFDAGTVRHALDVGRAEVAAAQAALDAAQVSVSEAGTRLDRFESVWRKSGHRVPSLNELEAARADAQRAKSEETAARARLEAARLRVEDGEDELGGAKVRAPMDGYIVSRFIEPGRRVREGSPLFALTAGQDRMTIAVPLAEAEASAIHPGAKASVRIDDMPDDVQQAVLARFVGGKSGQTAIFRFDRPSKAVRPGMRASVEIELPKRSGVLLVPDSALAFSPEGSAGRERDSIYLLGDDGQPRRVYVTAGASDGKRTEVFAQEIAPGAQVITGWRDTSADSREPQQEVVKQ
jgi:HlyD family secretion protein